MIAARVTWAAISYQSFLDERIGRGASNERHPRLVVANRFRSTCGRRRCSRADADAATARLRGLIPRACSDRIGDTVRHEMSIVALGHAGVGVSELAGRSARSTRRQHGEEIDVVCDVAATSLDG